MLLTCLSSVNDDRVFTQQIYTFRYLCNKWCTKNNLRFLLLMTPITGKSPGQTALTTGGETCMNMAKNSNE